MNDQVRNSAQQKLVDFVRGAAWKDFPAKVHERALMCLVDDYAALLAGTRMDVARIAREYARETWPGSAATIVPANSRVSSIGASFANATAANACDIDDCGIWTGGHPGAQLLPTALALCEQVGGSGKDLLSALVVGYEVAFRTGHCWHHRYPEFRACGSWGAVACAAIAAHLLRLPDDVVHHALGLAEYHSPFLPMMRDIANPAMAKHGMGWGPVVGITAVELAQRGYTGIPSLLSLPEYHGWVVDIGESYILPDGILWKEFSCCAWSHPAILAVRKLRERHNFDHADVESIFIESYREAYCLGTELPTTTEEAQFNVAWPVAAYLVDGEVGPAQVAGSRLEDPMLRSVASKVRLVESAELSRLYTLADQNDPEGKDAAVVRITLSDGTVLDSGMVENVYWEQPDWGRARMSEKFRWLVRDVLLDGQSESVLSALWQLESLDHAADLVHTTVAVAAQ